MVAEGLADHGSNGQVGDIVVVHDVKVNNVGTSLQHVVNFFAEFGKVSRKDGRSNEVVLVSPNIQRSGGTSRVLLSKPKKGYQNGERGEKRGQVRGEPFNEKSTNDAVAKEMLYLRGQ